MSGSRTEQRLGPKHTRHGDPYYDVILYRFELFGQEPDCGSTEIGCCHGPAVAKKLKGVVRENPSLTGKKITKKIIVYQSDSNISITVVEL